MGAITDALGAFAAPQSAQDQDLQNYIMTLPRPAAPNIVARGDFLPISRDDQGGVHFDPSAGVLGSLLRSASLPGDVYTGKVDPLSNDGVQRATEMAATLGTLGYGVPKPAEALGSAGGSLSRAKMAEMTIRAQNPGLDEASIQALISKALGTSSKTGDVMGSRALRNRSRFSDDAAPATEEWTVPATSLTKSTAPAPTNLTPDFTPAPSMPSSTDPAYSRIGEIMGSRAHRAR